MPNQVETPAQLPTDLDNSDIGRFWKSLSNSCYYVWCGDYYRVVPEQTDV